MLVWVKLLGGDFVDLAQLEKVVEELGGAEQVLPMALLGRLSCDPWVAPHRFYDQSQCVCIWVCLPCQRATSFLYALLQGSRAVRGR